MTTLAWVAAASLVLSASGESRREIAGVVPDAVRGASRVVWVSANAESGDASCALRTPAEWSCHDVPSSEGGIVAVVGDEAVAYQEIGGGTSAANGVVVAAWGRVIRIIPGGVAAEALEDLRLTAWKPVRPNARRLAQRFIPGEDTAIRVVRLSDVAFWVAGAVSDPDAFVRVEGPAIASTRIPAAALAEGPPELPLFLAMSQPISLSGLVQTAQADPVADAEVELLEPLNCQGGIPAEGDEPLIRRARTRAGADGSFVFEGLESGQFQVAAAHEAYGRGTARVDKFTEPVVVRLTDPGRVSGRVWQQGLPVAGGRVRFVPDASAWAASVDPGDHIVNDAYTATDGRFTLTLPIRRAGFVQVTAPDGATARLPVPPPDRLNASLGDITLPAPAHVTLRLLEGPADCDLFAVGPLGRLGLFVVAAVGSPAGYELALPEPGEWSISAACGGQASTVVPPVVSTGPGGTDPVLDIWIERPGSSEPAAR